jgi:hypothetical protein
MSAQPQHDLLTRARALSRIRRAARLVEYDLWRVWPLEDEKPGVIDDLMVWMIELADDLLEPDGPDLVIIDLVNHVLRSCAPSLDDDDKLVVTLLLHDRVSRNRAIARALAAPRASG